MNYHSYRSSPIRNLDTSQATKERFEDQFFQIRCARLEKEKKQLEDEVNLLSNKITDSSSKTQQILILNGKISELIEQNEALRITIDKLSVNTSSLISVHTKQVLIQQREEMLIDHRKEVNDLLTLYQTAKAETLLFRNENERLLSLYQLQRSRVNEVDDLNKVMEISKLKISITEIEVENNHLKDLLIEQEKQIQRLNKLYIYEKRSAEQKQKQHLIAISQIRSQEAESVKYFSVQENETPIKSMRNQVEYHSKQLEQELSTLRRRLEEQNEVYQAAIAKYTSLINQHQSVIRERDELRLASENALKETRMQNLVQRSRRVEVKKERTSIVEIERLKRQLNDKQEQIRSILTRFVPLTKIKEGEISLEEDRKQRIEKHWKADLAILDVLLVKYKVQIF